MHLVLRMSVSYQRGFIPQDTYAIAVFNQYVVVATDCHQEEHHLYVVEDMDPFLSLGSLSTNIKHAIC